MGMYRGFDLFVDCAGRCKNSYHLSCVGIGKELLRAASGEVIWLCTECLLDFNNWKDVDQTPLSPPTPNIHSEIDELKSQVSEIMDTLQGIVSHGISATKRDIVHSTPIAIADVQSKTNNSHNDEIIPDHDGLHETSETTTDERGFSLLLTNIDCYTTAKEVKTMIYSCLGVPADDRVSLVKLVSKNADYRLLDFVSFKVVLDWKWKDLAMRESTWPTGIKFREFRHRSTKTWKP